MWIAVGYGVTFNGVLNSAINPMGYSFDGIYWYNLYQAQNDSSIIKTNTVYSIIFNGDKWIASGQNDGNFKSRLDPVGIPSNNYWSSNGYEWYASSNNLQSIIGTVIDIAINGTRWVAVGQNNYNSANINDINYISIAYSDDNGITWTNSINSSNQNLIFGVRGQSIFWNGLIWVAVGEAINTIAWSSDGKTWTGLGLTIFSSGGFGIAWNGLIWVAVGNGINSIAWSSDGKTWTGLGTSIFSIGGYGISYNGNIWVAVGKGTNSIAWSSDGKVWTAITSVDTFSIQGYRIAHNKRRENTITFSPTTPSNVIDIIKGDIN